MSAAKNLTGKRFGRLIALKDIGSNKRKERIWKCQCDCGQIKESIIYNLLNGRTKSCGCYNRDRVSERSRKNLKGQRFGRLIALKSIKSDKRKERIWKCQCDCGQVKEVLSGRLSSGNTRSCGCLQKEKIGRLNRKNLKEQRFGRLVALKDAGTNKFGKRIWECQCDCGQIKEVISSHLLNGSTKSCGCYNRDRTSECSRKNLKGQRFGQLVALKTN